MTEVTRSRRSFLLSTGGMLGGTWLAAQWPQVVAAAHHAEASGVSGSVTKLEALSPAEAAQVEAITAQIIPSGATPGAREARVVVFVDRALATFFAAMTPGFRAGLGEFSRGFDAQHAGSGGFAAARAEEQEAYLRTVDQTPFFQMMRLLTVLGFLTSSKYGGNADGLGWKAIGFMDEHIFTPPFGDYDKEYQGFVPYEAEKRA